MDSDLSNVPRSSKLSGDESGASLLEFTLVLPLLLVTTLGLVDLGLLMFASTQADRATQVGARWAATNLPMANGIDGVIAASSGAISGTSCQPDPISGVSACTLRPSYTCSYTGNTGTCLGSNGSSLPIVDSRFFTAAGGTNASLVKTMQAELYSRTLDKLQVDVIYTPLQQGYVGRPKTPMNVTVRLKCVKQELFFIDDLLGLVVPSTACSGLPNPNGFSLNYSSTLPSEDLE